GAGVAGGGGGGAAGARSPARRTRLGAPPRAFDPAGASDSGMASASASHADGEASLGMRQSPRGESEPPEPTFGASGTQSRLNWLAKKRRRKTRSQCRMSPSV